MPKQAHPKALIDNCLSMQDVRMLKKRIEESQEWPSRGTDFAKFKAKLKQSRRGGKDKSFCDTEWSQF